MGLEAIKKEESEPVIIEILEYGNIEVVLSKMIIPFSEVLGSSKAPDVYLGYEKIPFEQRDPDFKDLMRKEFEGTMKRFIREHMV